MRSRPGPIISTVQQEPAALMGEPELAEFRRTLLAWYRRSRRDLPWRHTREPYPVWISEVMLQQTRVQAALPYFQRFLQRFPTVESLAAAPESDLLAHWAGLGYYHRARNLQRAAQAIVAQGGFPTASEELRNLPGIGAYTAAAIGSISFGLPEAVVDGNVLRVLSRLANDPADIGRAAHRRHFTKLAGCLLDPTAPGDHNQAMMELGATVCLPRQPQCLLCPVTLHCRARQSGTQDRLPVKTRKPQALPSIRQVLWIRSGERLLLWQRPSSARLMPGFWELPETHHFPEVIPETEIGSFPHVITANRYTVTVLAAPAPANLGPCQWIPESQLASLPLSTLVRKAQRLIGRGRRSHAQTAGQG